MQGTLSKMKTKLTDTVDYFLPVGDSEIYLNDHIGKNIELAFQNEIYCVSCGRKTKKSFAQGYCYPCFISSPETDECIFNPEKCQAHLGISRDMEWAEEHCLQPHFVYLAISSGLKVGVTRSTQIPTRWIDQGAFKAIKLAKTPNRYTAGLIEVELKKHFADKTNWQRMLKNIIPEGINLVSEKQKASDLLPSELQEYITNDDEITQIIYPVLDYPVKVKSLSFDKQPIISGKLKGIKGQYLIFDDNTVLNIRKHGGYSVIVSF